jgi:hypothetical protein
MLGTLRKWSRLAFILNFLASMLFASGPPNAPSIISRRPHFLYRVFETIEEIWEHRSAESAQTAVEFFRAELLSLPKKLAR